MKSWASAMTSSTRQQRRLRTQPRLAAAFARIIVTLIHALKARGPPDKGVATLCIGGETTARWRLVLLSPNSLTPWYGQLSQGQKLHACS
jgi:hypothetical protein